ncbi:DUF2278 family protein [Nonomuraea sp. NPDC003709]|uniref:DUF2278 family protein n=1 Tax=Nonomuraea sp. NPDC003709 TaxID=3154450 RepID=UPI0033AF1F24
MPLRSYGVLAGRAVDRRREGGADTPRYRIHLTDATGTDYRVAANVQSQQAPSELVYLAAADFRQITLLDDTGLKIHGVAYTADQANPEGWT